MFARSWVGIVMILLGACATERQPEVPPIGPALPSLNNLAALSRKTSATSQRLGADFTVSGGSITVVGNTAVFSPTEGEVAYAIYEFSTHDTTSIAVASYSLSELADGGTVWFAISDFEQGSWRMLSASELNNAFQFDDPAGTFSREGSTYLAVISFGDVLTVDSVALSFSGPVWQRSFGIEGMTGYPGFTAVTSEGLYVAATFLQNGTHRYVLARYSLSGELLGNVEPPHGHIGRPLAVAMDGSVYYGLYSEETDDQILLKLDTSLNVVWARHYETSVDYVYCESGAVDPATGDLIVLADSFTGEPTGSPKLLLRVSSQGDLIWQRASEPGSSLALPHLIVDKVTGDILAAGSVGMFAADWVVYRWNSLGSLVRYTQVRTPDQNNESARLDGGMLLDDAGNMYLAASDFEIYNHAYLVRFDPAGVLAQAVHIEGAGFSQQLKGLSFDAGGNVRIVDWSGRALAFAPEDFSYQYTLMNAVGKMHDLDGATYYVDQGSEIGQLPMSVPNSVKVSDYTADVELLDYTPEFTDMSGTFTPVNRSLEPFTGVLDEFRDNHIQVGCAYIDVN